MCLKIDHIGPTFLISVGRVASLQKPCYKFPGGQKEAFITIHILHAHTQRDRHALKQFAYL